MILKKNPPVNGATAEQPWLEERLSVTRHSTCTLFSNADSRIGAYEEASPFPVKQIDRTEKRAWLASKLPRDAVGAEIGVFRGHFAEVLCQVAKPRLLYLVDPWTLTGEKFSWGAAYTNYRTLKTVDAYEEAKLRVVRGGALEVVMVQGFFPECARAITNNLDWAYLDSSHTYEGTVAELEALDGLVSDFGVIAGDDWSPDSTSRHHGVFRAVQEFCGRSRWKIVLCGYLGQWMLKRY